MMRWKLLISVILILGIFGFFLTTEYGQPILDSVKNRFGDFTGFFINPKSENLFAFALETSTVSFYGLTPTRISNSTFSATGTYQFLKFGDQTFSLKNKNVISIYVKNLRGTFSISTEGVVKIEGDTNYMEVDDAIISSEKNSNVVIEIIPSNFILSDFVTRDFVMPSISGTVERVTGNNLDKVSFQNSKMEIKDFTGTIEFKDGTAYLRGLASLVKGDKFSFV